jgi:hypothetical protein
MDQNREDSFANKKKLAQHQPKFHCNVCYQSFFHEDECKDHLRVYHVNQPNKQMLVGTAEYMPATLAFPTQIIL